jgi:hypothetical protein
MKETLPEFLRTVVFLIGVASYLLFNVELSLAYRE